MEEPDTIEPTKDKIRYKSTKGVDDKRRQVSLLNLAKARQKKLEQLKEKKDRQEQEYEIGSDTESSSSSSEDEIIITKKNKDKKKGKSYGNDDRLSRLENMISSLVNKKEHKPRRVIEKRTVIQLPPQQQQGGYNPGINPQRQQLLNLI